eukprot:403365222
MGKMAKLMTNEEVMQGEDQPMILERTILQRVPEGKKIKVHEYESLLLDGVATPKMFPKDRVFLERFVNVMVLGFNSCSIRTLSKFPMMVKVVKLELQDNKIKAGLEKIIKKFPNLEILKLGNNYIDTLAEVKKLSKHKTLRSVELYGNPICEILNYTEKILNILPDIMVLDGQDRDGNEVVTDEEDVRNDDDSCDDYGDEQDMIADGVIQEENDKISSGGSGIGEDEEEEKKEGEQDEDDEYEEQKSSEESDPGEESSSSDDSTDSKSNNKHIKQQTNKSSNKNTKTKSAKSSSSNSESSSQSSNSSNSSNSSSSSNSSQEGKNRKLSNSQKQRLEQQHKLTMKKLKMLEYSSGSDCDDMSRMNFGDGMFKDESSSIINLGKRKAKAIRNSIYEGSAIEKRICIN